LQAENIVFLRGELKKMMDDIKFVLTPEEEIRLFGKHGYLG